MTAALRFAEFHSTLKIETAFFTEQGRPSSIICRVYQLRWPFLSLGESRACVTLK